jgi:hypothetical protein
MVVKVLERVIKNKFLDWNWLSTGIKKTPNTRVESDCKLKEVNERMEAVIKREGWLELLK